MGEGGGGGGGGGGKQNEGEKKKITTSLIYVPSLPLPLFLEALLWRNGI